MVSLVAYLHHVVLEHIGAKVASVDEDSSACEADALDESDAKDEKGKQTEDTWKETDTGKTDKCVQAATVHRSVSTQTSGGGHCLLSRSRKSFSANVVILPFPACACRKTDG